VGHPRVAVAIDVSDGINGVRSVRDRQRNLTREEWNRFFGGSGAAYRKACPSLPLP
jgi:hypothetical protein